MIAKWKLWCAAAVGVFALWLLAYTAVWREKTKYQVDWRVALNDWFGDVVMLGWVYEYQALVVGLLAAFSALALFANSSIERQRRIEDSEAERRARLFETMSALDLSLRHLGALVADDAPEARIDRVAVQIEQHCAAITHDAAPLANSVMYAVNGLETGSRDHNEKVALAWAGSFCLRHPKRYFRTGSFRFNRLKLSEDDQARLKNLRDIDKERYEDWLQMPD